MCINIKWLKVNITFLAAWIFFDFLINPYSPYPYTKPKFHLSRLSSVLPEWIKLQVLILLSNPPDRFVTTNEKH